MYEYMYLLRYRLEVSTGPKFPARPAKFIFGPARLAINVLENLYCTMVLKYYSKINIIT